MRNGHHQNNKRMRGRHQHHNNRKNQNPLTRAYESNGPDVKIRGTASTIAEKYIQLARDAQSSGDPVAAENYYQHAEHYFRLIAAVNEQFRQTQPYFRSDQAGADDGADDGDGRSARRCAGRVANRAATALADSNAAARARNPVSVPDDPMIQSRIGAATAEPIV